MKITDDLTRKIAGLARLELSDEEVRVYTAQLGRILEYVDELQRVPVAEDLEPLFHPLETPTPLREDVARPSPVDGHGGPRVLESAPEIVNGSYKVPQVVG